MVKCDAITCKGSPCKNNAEPGTTYCYTHGGKTGVRKPVSARCSREKANHFLTSKGMAKLPREKAVRKKKRNLKKLTKKWAKIMK